MTPPHPLLSFMARATLRLFATRRGRWFRGAAGEKSFLLSSQLNFAFPVETRREFS